MSSRCIILNAKLEAKEGETLDPLHEYLGPPALIMDHLLLGSSFDVKDHKMMDELEVGWILNVAGIVNFSVIRSGLYLHVFVFFRRVQLLLFSR